MRKVQFIHLDAQNRITRIPFEVRAERYEMAPISDLAIVPGEAQVVLKWKAEGNPFIGSHTVTRQLGAVAEWGKAQNTRYQLQPSESRVDKSHQFIDTDVIEEDTYTYRVDVRFKSGAELKSELYSVTVLPFIKATVLLQSYPNPFNPETWIPYELEKDADVTIELYNVNGQLVRRLDLGLQSRGRYTSREKAAYWDGRNKVGERAASGVYFYVFSAGDYTSTRKIVIVK